MKRSTPTAMKMPITPATSIPALSKVWMSHDTKRFVILPKPTFMIMKKTPSHTALESTEVHAHPLTRRVVCVAPKVSRSARRMVMPDSMSCHASRCPGSQKHLRTCCFTSADAIHRQNGTVPPKTSPAFAQSLMKDCCIFLMRGMLRKRRCSISQPTALATSTAMSTRPEMEKSNTVLASCALPPLTAACTYMAQMTRNAARAKMRTMMCSVLCSLGRTDSPRRYAVKPNAMFMSPEPMGAK
mmetsp:Transcript_8750/g.21289  ORF Transcript_8750/g.21289 Transcript_8750/m.21289 type:complete len:242 (+) Transcript_8750:1396-2121(+)